MKAYWMSAMVAFMLGVSQWSMAQQDAGQDFLSLLKSNAGSYKKEIPPELQMNRMMKFDTVNVNTDKKFAFSSQEFKKRS